MNKQSNLWLSELRIGTKSYQKKDPTNTEPAIRLFIKNCFFLWQLAIDIVTYNKICRPKV